MPEFVSSRFFLSPNVAQSFESDIETDFIAIFKAIGDGFRRIINAQRDTFYFVRFDAVAESRARKAKNIKRQRGDLRFPRRSLNSEPDFKRILRRQFVKAQSRQQTNHAFRDEPRRFQKTLPLVKIVSRRAYSPRPTLTSSPPATRL